MSLEILYVRPGGSGWGPVDVLARLAARTLEAELRTVDDRGDVSRLRKAAAALPRRRPGSRRSLLVLAPSPAHLAHAVGRRLFAPGYRTTAAWVIDSFWTDRLARAARHRGVFDQLFITDPDLLGPWRELTGSPVHALPWGSDTLAFPLTRRARPVDLLRLGRQPAAWDDDRRTARIAAEHDVRFAGRPAQHADPGRNQESVRAALLEARCVLAFSNLVSPAPYTHPARDYLTGRWTDALAAGSLVVGTAPAAAARVLWDGATAEVSPADPRAAMPVIRGLARDWDAERAAEQQLRARRTLDWRLRLRELLGVLDLPVPARLEDELQRL